ncbi:EI24 domain-containing protein [Marivivens aquimaris]|uniref:EI24 domain-containing protein n=1 Tax=Marivivens aquimaris TaxID=2774876 RepID=UPI001880E6AD|nr:EI24 domain-containing protein [Marivivens aquimaris]
MIFADFAKAIEQLSDHRFQRVVLKGVGLSFALLAGIYFLILTVIQVFVPETLSLPWIGDITWASSALSFGSLALMMVLSVFLMIPVASAITSFFLDDVAEAVEDKYYPGLPPVRPMGLWEGAKDGLHFLGILIVGNLVALVASLLLPFLAFAIFYGLNGYLLGREYFQLAAARRLGRKEAETLRKQNPWQIWMAGCLMAVPLSIPLLNLLIPVLGAATFTHLYHRLARR